MVDSFVKQEFMWLQMYCHHLCNLWLGILSSIICNENWIPQPPSFFANISQHNNFRDMLRSTRSYISSWRYNIIFFPLIWLSKRDNISPWKLFVYISIIFEKIYLLKICLIFDDSQSSSVTRYQKSFEDVHLGARMY